MESYNNGFLQNFGMDHSCLNESASK